MPASRFVMFAAFQVALAATVFTLVPANASPEPPVHRLHSVEAPVFYIWMDGESFRNLNRYPVTASTIFVDRRTLPIYAWHTPLGALIENLGRRSSPSYGTILVKVVLEKPQIIRGVDQQPEVVTHGELLFHVYSVPRMVQFHEWIFAAGMIKEWSAFTPEIESDIRKDLFSYLKGEPPPIDRHFYGRRFDRQGTIRAAKKILARFKSSAPIRRVKPRSQWGACEVLFTSTER